MFGHMTGTCLMPFHTSFMTIILMSLGMCILYILPIFLFHLGIIPLLVVPRGFPFLGNDYYHEFYGIENSFHDHDRDHVRGFETISHSLKGMVQIQLDETSDFLSKSHYFAHQ